MPPTSSGWTGESKAPASGKLFSITRMALKRTMREKHSILNVRLAVTSSILWVESELDFVFKI